MYCNSRDFNCQQIKNIIDKTDTFGYNLKLIGYVHWGFAPKHSRTKNKEGSK